MGATSLLYPMLIVICLFLIYSNEKKRRQYKKENIEVLYSLNEDEKIMRAVSSIMLIIMIVSSVLTIISVAKAEGLLSIDSLFIAFMPILFVVLYVPLSKKTKVTTLGVIKKSNLIRWEDIKGIDYLKPDDKGRQKVKILQKSTYKDMVTIITFRAGDEQIELFKSSAKEFRNNKKEKTKKK